jgi:hypothetical protein
LRPALAVTFKEAKGDELRANGSDSITQHREERERERTRERERL